MSGSEAFISTTPFPPDGDDASIRPNQIFAVSLPRQGAVVAVCRRHLLIAFGLRSLQPGISSHCGGGVRDRDGGYHQGPVWARLLGPFALAAYRVSGDATAAKAMLEAISNAMDNLSNVLEPIIMAILGLLVGALVIAMYLPIFKLGSVV